MIIIKDATVEEANLLADIGKRTFMESHGHSGPVADIASYVERTYSFDEISSGLADPENIFHIIYSNGRPAGYSRITFNTDPPGIARPNCTKLDRLYLLEEFHDRKLGLTLFNFIHDLAKNAGQSGIWLYVWIENTRAVKFYTRAGFRIIGKADFPISANHSNPNHLMFLEF